MRNPWIRWGLGLLLGVVLSGGVLLFAVRQVLKPAEGEWTESLRIGPWTPQVSMPAVLRLATHPFTLRLLEGRTLATRFGPVQWQAGTNPGTWRAVCAPCTLRVGSLGAEPVQVARAEFSVEPDTEMNLQGRFLLGDSDGPYAPLQGRWHSRITPRQLELGFSLTPQPIARVFTLFHADLPELRRVQIDGQLSGSLHYTLPSRSLKLKPRIDGFRVAGLGTEALLNAEPACPRSAADEGFGLWLPRAVVAAEDQRFFEHAGFDLADILSAWSLNRAAGDDDLLHGGSTLSQQLAKLIYAGDQRSHARKLRELLYAVELDRTLGKARVMNLYLAMAPWGQGLCGAHAAARKFLNKPAAALTPMEAVWLASLLHNPDRELTRMARNGQVNTTRVMWVAEQLRPSPAKRRDAWLAASRQWSPPPVAFASALAVAASEAAIGR